MKESIEVLYQAGQETLFHERKESLYAPAMELNKWVRAARKWKGWTQDKLAGELHLTKANISGWENAKHLPSYSQVARITELTGYPPPNTPKGQLPVSPFANRETGNQMLEFSPIEADLLHAFRQLPEDEQQELVHDVMARAERLEQLVQRALAKRGIEVTGYVSANRAAEHLPSAPSQPPPGAATPPTYDHLGEPSAWRHRQHAAAKVDVQSSHGMDEVEIPAFLRKQPD